MTVPALDPEEERKKKQAESGYIFVLDLDWWTEHKFAMNVMQKLRTNLHN